MVPSPLLLSCESSVSVKENPDRNQKQAFKTKCHICFHKFLLPSPPLLRWIKGFPKTGPEGLGYQKFYKMGRDAKKERKVVKRERMRNF